MAFLDHFAPNAGLDTAAGENGFVRWPAHQIWSFMAFVVAGKRNKADLVSKYSMTATDEIQLDAMSAVYQGKSVADKIEYVNTVHATFMSVEIGDTLIDSTPDGALTMLEI